jgi:ribosomal protein S8
MSQDVISDTLNMLMNARRANKSEIVVKKTSKLLLSVLAIAKLNGYVSSYTLNSDKTLSIKIGKLNSCNAIKPRFLVSVDEIEKYTKRYLPARNLGTMIISTSKGLMTHNTAFEKNTGGSLIAYFY